MQTPENESRRHRLPRLLREPIVQFLCLGALLFGVMQIGPPDSGDADRRIIVNDAVKDRLARLYEKQMGTSPGPETLASLVDDYIHDEVLYREALRLGLDKNDTIIKRRLVQKMAFLAGAPAADAAAGSEAALRQYYRDHAREFAKPATVTFDHVYFSPDRGGWPAARDHAAETLRTLKAGDSAPADEMGDPFPLQNRYSKLTPPDAIQLFGDTAIATRIFETPAGVWAGPVKSGFGWHVIRVADRTAEHVPPFEDVRADVASAMQQTVAEESAAEAYKRMKARYEIVRPQSEPRP